MISDFQILGIEEGSDLKAIKSAFRRRAKELHPDLSSDDDALKRYDLFVAVCKAYKRLIGDPASDAKGKGERGGATGDAHRVAIYSDPAYAFYKAGMKHYMRVHPSQWNLGDGGMLNTKIAGQDEEQEAIRKRVMDLVKLFPKAYYYFSIVVHEYPDSEWAYDAGEKMEKIEERIGMYRNIIASFSTWNVDEKEAIREYQEKYGKMNEGLKAVRRDMPKDWRW